MEETAPTTAHTATDSHGGRRLLALSLAALGVVYGDIGTSPLYAMRECFHGPHAVVPSASNVLGVLSLIFWSLVVVITIKYLAFVMRADNRGEGGILALTSLVTRLQEARPRGSRWALVAMGLFGAALLYGDGMITPAISVLSAVEGLEVATPFFAPYVVPLTIAILVVLFLLQRIGTAGMGRLFGPVTLVWFAVLAALGAAHVIRAPGVLVAVSPLHGFDFFLRNGWHGFLVLGSVFLVVTGGEALYADMGHFGRSPIRRVWFAVVLPALVVNYFGQGALLLSNPEAAHNPFYRLAPAWALYPLVALATAATVIASQAVITGAFSLTRQAVQLGYSPRLEIRHTSPTEIGQIYMPFVNWGLMLACIGLVLGFGSSSRLAAAYGVAVTTTMVVTTILFFVVLRERRGWSLWKAALLCLLFLVVDLAFFGANIIKVADGGWFPLAVAAAVFLLMTTWKKGRRVLGERLRAKSVPLADFIGGLKARRLVRVPGTAVFMYGNAEGVPPALLHNIEHNKVLHERVVILMVETKEVSHVKPGERVEVEPRGEGFYRVSVRYGFMEDPDIPAALRQAEEYGLEFRPEETTYFLGRETLIATEKEGLSPWRGELFATMARNARRATIFFRIPPDRVIEVGTQVEL